MESFGGIAEELRMGRIVMKRRSGSLRISIKINSGYTSLYMYPPDTIEISGSGTDRVFSFRGGNSSSAALRQKQDLI